MYKDARKVFEAVCSLYEVHKGVLNWYFTIADIEKQTGLKYNDINTALGVLIRKELVQRDNSELYSMTNIGADAYDVPSDLDVLLPVRL